jgi:hypothetical protein
MNLAIVWVLFAAWAGICIFYLSKLSRIARSHRLPLFASPVRYNKTIRALVRHLFLRLILATIIFIITVLLAYFVKYSSPE